MHDFLEPVWTWTEVEGEMTATATFKCACGDEKEIQDVSAQVTSGETAATCVVPGSVVYTAAVSFNGKEYTSEKTVETPVNDSHNWGETAQTCTAAAVCMDCGHTLAAKGHDWKLDKGNSPAATCEKEGKNVYTCANGCGATKEEVVEAIGHSYKYIGETENGCQVDKKYQCDNCKGTIAGAAQTGTASDTYYKHSYTATLTVEATCSVKGEKIYSCVCGDSYTEEVPTNDSHNWDAGVTNTETGVITYTCKDCKDATKTVVVPKADGTVEKAALAENELELPNNTAVSLDENVLKGENEDASVKISVDKVKAEDTKLDKDKYGQLGKDAAVYDFNMEVNGQKVSEFKGYVTITLPYELQDGDDVNAIAVWYIDDDGSLKEIKATYSNGFVTFTTNHFSYYTVTRLTPAQRCGLYGHVEVTTSKAATCTEDGFEMVKCQRCGVVLSNEVEEMLGHDYKKKNEVAATCETEGSYEDVCETCGDTRKVTVPALGHDYKEDTAQSLKATCEAAGKTVYVCSHDAAHTYTEVIAQKDHEWVSKNKKPDCNNKGHDKKVCDNCGIEQVLKEYGATGHAYSAETAVWEWSEDHTSAKVTLVCAYEESHTKELHAAVTVTEKATTCLGSGSVTYSAKAVFNKLEVTAEYTETVDAPGHKPGTAWETSEGKHYHICTVCKEKVDQASHNWGDAVVTREPTCGEAGVSSVACIVCGYKTEKPVPATGDHTIKNGVCTVCGYVETDCEHLYLREKDVDLSGLGICAGADLAIRTCDCGYQSQLVARSLTCKFEDCESEMGFDPQGNEMEIFVQKCSECGLTLRSSYYGEVSTDPCGVCYIEWGELIKDGKTVAEQHFNIHEMFMSHTDVVLKELVDMGEKGLCSGNIMIRTCPCGENSYIYEDNACEWSFTGSEGAVNFFTCSICGAEKTITDTVEQDDCTVKYTSVFTYFLNGEEVYSATLEGTQEEHPYEVTKVERMGETCEDGVVLTRTCSVCGAVNRRYSSWHDEVIKVETDISGYDICCDTYVQYSCACKENPFQSSMLMSSTGAGCQWEVEQRDEATGYFFQRCRVCGATAEKVTVFGEKNEVCMSTNVSTITYTDKNGQVIIVGENRSETQTHDWQVNYNLRGDSCEDGITITRTCADCGESYTEERDWHEVEKIQTYDLTAIDMCFNSVSVWACPCGQEIWTGWGEGEPPCQWEDLSGDEHSHVSRCTVCGITKTESWVDLEGIDACHVSRREVITLTKGEEELLTFSYDCVRTTHTPVFELTLKEGATTCEDGFYVKETCTVCGDVSEGEDRSPDCNAWPVARRTLAEEGVLCGKLELVDYRCACGKRSWTSEEWGEDRCHFEDSYYSEEDGAWVHVCNTCGAEKLVNSHRETIEGESCMYYVVEHTVIRTKDQKPVAEYDARYLNDDHRWIHRFEMLGQTCADGYYIYMSCAGCGIDGGMIRNNTCEAYMISHEVIHDGAGLCGPILLLESACPCGAEHHIWTETACDMRYAGMDDQIGEERFVCKTCGLERTSRNISNKIEGQCKANRYMRDTFIKDGQQIAQVEKEFVETAHQTMVTFELMGATCDDGYYVTWDCLDCDYVRREDWPRYGHEGYLLGSYNLADYGVCGGWVEEHGCACGQDSGMYCEIACNWRDTGKTDPETGLMERYCSNCNTYIYQGIVENQTEGCTTVGTRYFKLVRNGEVLLNLARQVTETRHDMLASLVLNDKEQGCEGGYTVTETCTRCGISYSNTGYGHGVYTTKRIDLADYGSSCGGWFEQATCACGKECHISYNINCNTTHKEWTETGDDGVEYRFIQRVCPTCGLDMVERSYDDRVEGVCEFRHYENLTIRMGDTYVADLVRNETWYDHIDDTYTYTLLPGSVSCEDGVQVRQTCAACGWDQTWEQQGHGMNRIEGESIDLTAYGSICGGTLELYRCPCGAQSRYDFSDDLRCDLGQQSTGLWIPGAEGYREQWSTMGWRYYHSNAWTITCAVTDPTACGLKIRMAEYWLVEDCIATEYQTWQLGYDAETGTCLKEITLATGKTGAYHNYVQSNSTETLDDGTVVNINSRVCSDCASTYIEKNYHLNGTQTKWEEITTNTLNNGERKQRTAVAEYGYHYGNSNYATVERNEYIEADGTTSWEMWEYTYDDAQFAKNCGRTCTYTSSWGNREVYENYAHHNPCRDETVKQPTCTQFGTRRHWHECEVCGIITDDNTYETEPTAHYWYWSDDKQVYICDTCGLESKNGASGSIVIEDMTKAYGNDTAYVVGYWNRGNVQVHTYLSVILDGAAEGSDELVLSGIDFTELNAAKDGITAISFNKAAADKAAAAAVREAGYTGTYALRLSFVPMNSEDTLDYAITFDSVTAE